MIAITELNSNFVLDITVMFRYTRVSKGAMMTISELSVEQMLQLELRYEQYVMECILEGVRAMGKKEFFQEQSE